MRWRFGLKVRRLMPVIFVPTPPRYFFLPRVVTWLPNEVFLPLTSHSRPIGPAPSRLLGLAWLGLRNFDRSDFFFGHGVVRLAPLDVAALLDQVADLVGRDRELTLRADVQGDGDQRVVAPPHSLFGFGSSSLWY